MLGEVGRDPEAQRDRADDGDQEDRGLGEAQRQATDEMRMLARRRDGVGEEHRGRRLQSSGRFAVGLRRFLIHFTRHDATFADALSEIKEGRPSSRSAAE